MKKLLIGGALCAMLSMGVFAEDDAGDASSAEPTTCAVESKITTTVDALRASGSPVKEAVAGGDSAVKQNLCQKAFNADLKWTIYNLCSDGASLAKIQKASDNIIDRYKTCIPKKQQVAIKKAHPQTDEVSQKICKALIKRLNKEFHAEPQKPVLKNRPERESL